MPHCKPVVSIAPSSRFALTAPGAESFCQRRARYFLLLAVFVVGLGCGAGLLQLFGQQAPQDNVRNLKAQDEVLALSRQPAKAFDRPRHSAARVESSSFESVLLPTLALIQQAAHGDFLDDNDIDLALDSLDALGDDDLAEIIHNYTHLAPHDYPLDVDQHDFARRLGQLYSRDPRDSGNDPLDVGEQSAAIAFSDQLDEQDNLLANQEQFRADTRRIYAGFNTSDYSQRNVMVKWSRLDSPEVLIYDKYPVNTAEDENYVWLEKPDNWQPGEYQVEIFSLADNLSLLASGRYDIAPVYP